MLNAFGDARGLECTPADVCSDGRRMPRTRH
jgi:hypothetical protein